MAVALFALLATGFLVATSNSLKVRAAIIIDKATGNLVDIEWSDLGWLLRPGEGDFLAKLDETHNPFKAIESPFRAKSDLEAGEILFRDRCSSCHGEEARGGAGGPSLRDREFRQGRTDWALYRTITRGVPGTAMLGQKLPRNDVWRLVSYLNESLLASNTNTAPNAPQLQVEPVNAAELQSVENSAGEWLTYSGSYSGQRHSGLNQINRDNVQQLQLAWQRQFTTREVRVETTPIVRGSTMFVTEPPNFVHALDAASGKVLWTYARNLQPGLHLCCGTVNRGVAILGRRVFYGTLDAHLLALDADTGKVDWDVAVADPASGYSITSAPLAVDDMVIVGVAGGEYGIRGFLDAYDAATGKRRWRFYTVPAAGEPGSETWGGDSLRRGGAPTWLTGSFDAESRTLYWGVGNPSPNFYGADRGGDNLYSNSVIALDIDSGKPRWYFQFTPHDLHDWDAAQVPVLVNAVINNAPRKLLAWANRNAFYYLLDRVTGKYLLGTPFAKQTWADGLDEAGRPRMRPESMPTPQGTIVFPSEVGGTNWWSPSFDPERQLIYVPTIDRPGVYYASADRPDDDSGEKQRLGSAETGVRDTKFTTAVKALELATGKLRWQYLRPARDEAVEMGGVMSTAAGIVFGGDDETFFALDADTGKELWQFAMGGEICAAPISYALNGRQYVAIAAGRSILAFALSAEVVATKLPARAP